MDIDERTVVYGETTFTIEKLPAWPDGFRCWEVVRTVLEPIAEKASAADMSDFFAGVRDQIAAGTAVASRSDRLLSHAVAAKMVTTMRGAVPPAIVEDVRARLFKGVWFEAEGVPKRRLAGSEEHAFTDVGHIYLLFARAAAVNFSESLVEMFSHILGDDPSSLSPEP